MPASMAGAAPTTTTDPPVPPVPGGVYTPQADSWVGVSTGPEKDGQADPSLPTMAALAAPSTTSRTAAPRTTTTRPAPRTTTTKAAPAPVVRAGAGSTTRRPPTRACGSFAAVRRDR